jgi:hypothetical protein
LLSLEALQEGEDFEQPISDHGESRVDW